MAAPRSLYEEAVEQLDKNQSIGWDLAVDSFRQAASSVPDPQTQAFLQRALHQVVSILLDQNPVRINAHQRECVETTLHFATRCMVQLLEMHKTEFVPVLFLLFSKKRTYYKATGFNYYGQGNMEARLTQIRAFAQDDGFGKLMAALQARQTPWLGSENVKILLHAACDARQFPPQPQPPVAAGQQPAPQQQAQMVHYQRNTGGAPEDLCRYLVGPLQGLSEEELKKESQHDSSLQGMTHLVCAVRRALDYHEAAAAGDPATQNLPRHADGVGPETEAAMQFWLALVLAHLRSSSLPLRLWAWEEMGKVVEYARACRPPARRYRVKGAGQACANGIYEYTRTRNGSEEYQHTDDATGVTLTLFRCKMRSNNKWWFISEADKDAPGTDKDLDYYQHRSTAAEEREPQPRGWQTCTGQAARGLDPPPTLERLEPLCPEGQEEASLEHQLARWVLDQRVVEDVFGPSIHREVVSRATRLLHFLADMRALSPQHLDLVWLASVGLAEAEAGLGEEIRHALVGLLCLGLDAALGVHLLGSVRQSLADGALEEALAFVERLGPAVNVHQLHARVGAEVVDALLVLLWDLLQHPSTRAHEQGQAAAAIGEEAEQGGPQGQQPPVAAGAASAAAASARGMAVVSHLFAQALHAVPGGDRRGAFLEQCLTTIQASASYDGPVNGGGNLAVNGVGSTGSLASLATAHSGGVGEGAFDEPGALHALHMARFLLETYQAPERAAVLEALAAGFRPKGEQGAQHALALPDLLFRELQAFKCRTARVVGAGVAQTPTNRPHHSGSSSARLAARQQAVEEGVRVRLEVLRYVHSGSPRVQLGFPQLTAVWGALTSPPEKELFLVFFADACRRPPPLPATTSKEATTAAAAPAAMPLPLLVPRAFSHDVMLAAFREFACRQADWTALGKAAYAAFSTLFAGLRAERAVEAGTVGLDALWRIALTARNPAVAEAATRDLLLVYDDHTLPVPELEAPAGGAGEDGGSSTANVGKGQAPPQQSLASRHLLFLKRIFDYLGSCRDKLQGQQQQQQQQQEGQQGPETGGGGDTCLQAERCLRLLQGAIGLSGASAVTGAGAEGQQALAHGVRGMAGRRAVGVEPKKVVPAQAVGPGRSGQGGSLQKLEPFVVLLHPLETVGVLRRLIAQRCGHPPELVKMLASGKALGKDDARIGTLGLVEDVDVLAILMTRQPAPAATTVQPLPPMVPAAAAGPAELQQPAAVIAGPHLPQPQEPQPAVDGEAAPMVVTTEEGTAEDAAAAAAAGEVAAPVAEAGAEGSQQPLQELPALPMQPPAVAHEPSTGSEAAAGASVQQMEVKAAVSIGDVIAGEQQYCHVLFDLLECPAGAEAGFAHVIWELLLVLPTHVHALELVRQAAALGTPAPEQLQQQSSSTSTSTSMSVSPGPAGTAGAPDWSALILARAGWHRAVYCLQVVDHLLQPAEGVVAAGPPLLAADPRAFRQAFLRTGGFSHVLDLFMRTNAGSSGSSSNGAAAAIQRMATAVALRIVKFYLFGESAAAPAPVAAPAVAPMDEEERPPEAVSVAQEEGAEREQHPAELVGGTKRVRQLLGRLLEVAAQTHQAALGTAASNSPAFAAAPSTPSSAAVAPPATPTGGGADAAGESFSSSQQPSGAGEAEAPAWEVTVDALATVEMLLRRPEGASGRGGAEQPQQPHQADEELVSALVGHALAPELLVALLLRNPQGRVREQARDLVLATNSPALSRAVFGWCLGALERLEPECQTCGEFFDVLQGFCCEEGEAPVHAAPPPPSLPPPSREQAPLSAADVNVSRANVNGTSSRLGAVSLSVATAPTPPTGGGDDLLPALARLVATRLGAFPRGQDEGGRGVLLGYLGLVRALTARDRDGSLFAGTPLADVVVQAFDELLFAVPTLERREHRPVCAPGDVEARRLVFETLLARARQDPAQLRQLLHRVGEFAAAGASSLRRRWSYECGFEAKAGPGQYVGLRNQGCTCYMNSLLQNLFMVPSLRDTLLAARVKKRKVLDGPTWVQQKGEQGPSALVGNRVLVRWEAGQELEALVADYHEAGGEHQLRYEGCSSRGDEDVRLALARGRPGKEVGGAFQVIPPPLSGPLEQVQEQEATQRVLQEVQRTFCYLRWSEKRFYDPRLLVEACRCLNLQYSVYQQNDAAEFCDQLVDRLEAALKGSPQLAGLQACFGGQMVSQKIPQGCEHRTETEYPFVRMELIIRGKESVEESLAAFVAGETMDGDNKVECEGCGGEKQAVKLRTCLGRLPNVLLLHLKRFDLDFTTFETVKLNNRCAFPMRLNVKPYTREGLRLLEEQAQQQSQPGDMVLDDNGQQATADEDDAEDYEYELKGVVIHAGVAQGGHYYSYIKDRAHADRWYRFDDEDVLPFDPATIEQHCFGGVASKTTTWNGVARAVDEERVANALMLFYEKVRPLPPPEPEPVPAAAATTAEGQHEEQQPPQSEPSAAAVAAGGAQEQHQEGDAMDVAAGADGGEREATEAEGGASFGEQEAPPQPQEQEQVPPLHTGREEDDFERGLDGQAAFEEEVWRANVDFVRHTYLLDAQLHSFLAGLLALVFQPLAPPPPLVVASSAPTVGSPPRQPPDAAAVTSTPPPLSGSGATGGGDGSVPTSRRKRKARAGSIGGSPGSPALGPQAATTPSTVRECGMGGSSLGGLLPSSTAGVDPQLAHPSAPPLWDPLGAGQALVRQDALGVGARFLVDVMLHARDRPCVHLWLAHLCRAFALDAGLAAWFVDRLLLPPQPLPPPSSPARDGEPSPPPQQQQPQPSMTVGWLRGLFLECSDSTARAQALQLVLAVIEALAAQESEAQALLHAPLEKAEANSRVARVLVGAMRLLEEAPRHWRHVDELFCLFRDAAKGSEAVRAFLVRADLVAVLALLVVGEHAPPLFKNRFPWVDACFGGGHYTRSAWHHPQDYLYLLEAVVTLVGVPQPAKHPLLEEVPPPATAPDAAPATAEGAPAYGVGGGERRLTRRASLALTAVFREHTRHNTAAANAAPGMGLHDMVRYLERCAAGGGGLHGHGLGQGVLAGGGQGGGHHNGAGLAGHGGAGVSHLAVKQILGRYDTTAEGRLTLAGFLDYYRDTAAYSAKQVYQDLHAHGFRCDLQRQGEGEADADGGGAEEGEEEGEQQRRRQGGAVASWAGVGGDAPAAMEDDEEEEDEDEERKEGEGKEEHAPAATAPSPRGAGEGAAAEGEEQVLRLPKDSELALAFLPFYPPMMDVLTGETCGVLQRVVRGNWPVSERAARQLLCELERSMLDPQSAQHSQQQEAGPAPLPPVIQYDRLMLLLHAYLDVADALQARRVEFLLFDPESGLVSTMLRAYDKTVEEEGGGDPRRVPQAAVYRLAYRSRFFYKPVALAVNERLHQRPALHERVTRGAHEGDWRRFCEVLHFFERHQGTLVSSYHHHHHQQQANLTMRQLGPGAVFGNTYGQQRRGWGGRHRQHRRRTGSMGSEEEDEEEDDEEFEDEDLDGDDDLSDDVGMDGGAVGVGLSGGRGGGPYIPPIVTVVSAGVPEVNGEYVLDEMRRAHDRAPFYRRPQTFKLRGPRNTPGERVGFYLYRCVMEGTGERRWFLSRLPEGADPGGNADVDFYENPTALGALPPENGWRLCDGAGRGPVPRVVLSRLGEGLEGEFEDGDEEDEERFEEEGSEGAVRVQMQEEEAGGVEGDEMVQHTPPRPDVGEDGADE